MKPGRYTPKNSFDEQNLEAARIIAADPQRYAGLMLDWARLILERSEPRQKELFQGKAA